MASGNLLSVINVLMQLRKVCNHPNLFEVRPTISPFQSEGVRYHIPSIVYSALEYDPFKVRPKYFLLNFVYKIQRYDFHDDKIQTSEKLRSIQLNFDNDDHRGICLRF